MRVSLVMPTWNGGPLLGEVLAAVERQPGAGDLERVAIDSGSRDDTVERLLAHGFTVHAIDQRDFDHGATRDLAIARTTGDVIVLLTQDATPADERWLPALVESYAEPRVAAAYCRQVPRPDCNPFLAQRLQEWTAGRPEPVLQQLDDPARWESLPPLQRLALCAFDNVASSLRRSTWERFRFGRRPFGEDVAFGKRVIRAGLGILYQPKSAVIHSHSRTPRDEGKRIYCDHRNLHELFGVHTIPTLRALRAAIRWGRDEFGRQVAAMDLPAAERTALARWARGYAWWSAVGQYLGGNAHRLEHGLRGVVFRPLGRWLAGGI